MAYMKNLIRKLICWLIGCNYICLHRRLRTWEDNVGGSTFSGWQCTRCDVDEWSNGMNKRDLQRRLSEIRKQYGPMLTRLSKGVNGDNTSISEHFECICSTPEHTIRFKLEDYGDNDTSLYMSIFLDQYHGFFSRLWIAIKYIFGYKCKYGHWDCTMFKVEDADRLIELLEVYKKLSGDKNVS